jgi:hypothetical protein
VACLPCLTDSQRFVSRLFCLGDSISSPTLHSRRLRTQSAHSKHKAELLDPWREGGKFVSLIALASLCSVLETLIVVESSLTTVTFTLIYASQKRLVWGTIKNIFTWSVVLIWNLVLLYGGEEKEIFLSWRFCMFFCLLDFPS